MASPLRAASLPVRLRLYLTGGGIERAYARKALRQLTMSAMVAPIALLEGARHGRQVARTPVRAPLFVIGHWRSGTTHLQNVLAQDPAFGYPTLFQTVFPRAFLSLGSLQGRLARRLPETRPMDGVRMGLDLPQEDEFALANLCRYSFYHGLCFPRRAREYFTRYVLFDGERPPVVAAWKRHYADFLKKVTYASGGRPLVLKNPANTARIRLLLELFPDARFVHIQRNPWEVFVSTVHMMRTLSQTMRFHSVDEAWAETLVLENYERMMARYLEERALVPAGRLMEVRYEDLVEDPLPVMQGIYEGLGLPGHERARPHFARYLESLGGYRTNAYDFPPEVIARVGERWHRMIEHWGYAPPVGRAAVSTSHT
jgi:omega-hydroxy-beta-dihydromenaquinone-9 sulfotransferase